MSRHRRRAHPANLPADGMASALQEGGARSQLGGPLKGRCQRMSASDERWHSIREIDPKVYHDDPTCPDGATVELTHRREGTAGRRKCDQCRQESGLAWTFVRGTSH